MKRVPIGLQFSMLALAWGASFLFIKVGLDGLSAGQVVLGRLSSGALMLLLISAVTTPHHLTRRRPARWPPHVGFLSVLLASP